MIPQTPATTLSDARAHKGTTIDDIIGQEGAKRGLTIAAAGRHNIGLFGPPGTGKTLLAKSLQSIMPALTFEESLEVTALHSMSSNGPGYIHVIPPIRSPHHSASYASIVGGGSPPRPGEITLAHRGILILDEFPEFSRNSLEALRQPLEDGSISISRGSEHRLFPARFTLVATLNPCPCGNRGGASAPCTCSAKDLSRYQGKLSGPIMDRIDMWIEVPVVQHERLSDRKSDSSETEKARALVTQARRAQRERYGYGSALNGDISVTERMDVLMLSEEARNTLNLAAESHNLSGRGYHKVIKLARTIADLEQSPGIEKGHVLEALRYRKK